MPNLPTISSTGWGTTLNTFLETAHDNGTDATKSGKVKPSGIIGGSTGQILTTDAGGIPTWGSASTNQTLYKLDTNIKVQTMDFADTFVVPSGFPYLLGYNLSFEFKRADQNGGSSPNEATFRLFLTKEGVTAIPLGYAFSRWELKHVMDNTNPFGDWLPTKTVKNAILLPINITGWTIQTSLSFNTTYLSSFHYLPYAQIVLWNGE